MAGIISSTELHKLQKYDVVNGKDMISDLPDSILHYILSLLTTEEALRTSILARKWRYLWTDLSVLDFVMHAQSCTYSCERRKQFQRSANRLLDLVDRLLRKSICVQKRLRLAVYDTNVDADKVHSLLSAVVQHKVQDLDISLVLKQWFVLPRCFSASESLTKLNLELDCVLNIPCDIGLPSLKILELSLITFANEESVQRLFSGCPVLQELIFYNCDWKNIKQISLTTPALMLLNIYYPPLGVDADDLFDCTVQIEAVNLIAFSCTSYLTEEFVLVNLNSIVNAYIEVVNCFPSKQEVAAHRAMKLLSGLGGVESLRLSNDTLECLSYANDAPHLLPSFPNLTHLDVLEGSPDFSCELLMDLLRKTPKLEALDIAEGFDPAICLNGEEWTLNAVPFCFKSCLKSFSISNFEGGEADMELLKFLLKNATVLGEIQIFCSEGLFDDLEKQADIRNILQPSGPGSCVIEFP